MDNRSRIEVADAAADAAAYAEAHAARSYAQAKEAAKAAKAKAAKAKAAYAEAARPTAAFLIVTARNLGEDEAFSSMGTPVTEEEWHRIREIISSSFGRDDLEQKGQKGDAMTRDQAVYIHQKALELLQILLSDGSEAETRTDCIVTLRNMCFWAEDQVGEESKDALHGPTVRKKEGQQKK